MTPLASLASATITIFLAFVLARAAWHKLDQFLETVGFAQGYELVPDRWAALIVRGLMLAEITCVLLLLYPGSRAFGGLMAAALFAGYGAIMALALFQGRERIECGCGGAPQILSGFTLARNAALTIMALAVASFPVLGLSAPEAAAAIGGALVLMTIYTIIEKLASHLPHIRQEGH